MALCLGATLWACAIAGAASASMGSLAPRNPAASANAQQQWTVDPHTNCRALDADYDPGDSILWQGACVGGLASGPGTLSFLNNGKILETITGTFGGGALLPGHVSAVWSDGSKYDGAQLNEQFEGVGAFVSATGDKINGEWKAGALNGKANVIWANGDRYDGEWKDGKSDGQGTEIWANGDRFDGLWKDGSPETPNAPRSANATAHSSLASTAPARVSPATQPPQLMPAATPQQNAAAPIAPAILPLHDFVGKTLTAVDGSTIALDQNEGGLTRVVTLPTGVAQQTSFAFMSERIGTVSSESAAIGLFRANGDEIDTNYIDGKTEIMKSASDGGILLTSRSPDGNSACTAWYPEGHVFSQDEKRAAVEEYASRLGVNENSAPKKHHVVRAGAQSCGGAFLTNVAAAGQAPPPQQSLLGSAAPGDVPSGMQAIPVRDSTVHLIDAPYEPSAAPQPIQDVNFSVSAASPHAAALPPASPPPAAQTPANVSQCLSVTNNGGYWGFQNRCGTAIQFAYCEMSDANPLTACHHTSVSGSVAANGFSALVNAASLSQQGADHEFRWMACDGGAGEVVPHLDSVDPPSGRCLRAVPIGAGTRVQTHKTHHTIAATRQTEARKFLASLS
jgi:hypothetical protein